MKIDLLTQKKNYMYSPSVNVIPYWQPHADAMQYDVRTDGVYCDMTADGGECIIIIGWESMSTINNITLDIDGDADYSKIQLLYSDDSFTYGFSEATKFNTASWYPQQGGSEAPLYLNDTLTQFKPFVCNMIKIIFTTSTDVILNNIEIESEETINIDKDVLEPFVFERFISNVLPMYTDTSVKELAEQTMIMLDGDMLNEN